MAHSRTDHRRRYWPGAFVAGALALLTPAAASAAAAIAAVPLGAFTAPVHVAVAPGQPRLLFVVEQPGRIHILLDEQRLALPFLDIRDLVLGPPDPGAGGEQGLLSVAFPPDYNQSRRFYVFFTNLNGDLEIDEFQRSASNAGRADRTTRRIVMAIPHRDRQNHNGGQMQFTPDGLLYIATGDGAAAPIGEQARNLESLLGKILRIHPRAAGASRYRVPRANPFVGIAGRDEIFAYGFRNPWRFSITGPWLAVGDVGQTRIEEINILPTLSATGGNFGWPQYEGRLIFDPSRPGSHPPRFPIFSYDHEDGGCAVIGGFLIRDADLPRLRNNYIYCDICTGDVRVFVPDLANQIAYGDRSTGLVLPGLTSFGEGFGGQLYATQTNGSVSRLEPTPP